MKKIIKDFRNFGSYIYFTPKEMKEYGFNLGDIVDVELSVDKEAKDILEAKPEKEDSNKKDKIAEDKA